MEYATPTYSPQHTVQGKGYCEGRTVSSHTPTLPFSLPCRTRSTALLPVLLFALFHASASYVNSSARGGCRQQAAAVLGSSVKSHLPLPACTCELSATLKELWFFLREEHVLVEKKEKTCKDCHGNSQLLSGAAHLWPRSQLCLRRSFPPCMTRHLCFKDVECSHWPGMAAMQ